MYTINPQLVLSTNRNRSTSACIAETHIKWEVAEHVKRDKSVKPSLATSVHGASSAVSVGLLC